jgi:hypothetical protein
LRPEQQINEMIGALVSTIDRRQLARRGLAHHFNWTPRRVFEVGRPSKDLMDAELVNMRDQSHGSMGVFGRDQGAQEAR